MGKNCVRGLEYSPRPGFHQRQSRSRCRKSAYDLVKSDRVISEVISSAESESEESERFHFFRLRLRRLRLRRLWSSENQIVGVGSRSGRTSQSQGLESNIVIGSSASASDSDNQVFTGSQATEHKQNRCSFSDSVGLIFIRAYLSSPLITTSTTIPSLLKTSIQVACSLHPVLCMLYPHPLPAS